MPTNTKNRADARQALATLLEAELKTNQGLVTEVYNHLKGDFELAAPVIMVSSGGIQPRQQGINSLEYDSLFRLRVLIFVADAEKDDADYTDEIVEDTLDGIVKAVMDVVGDNRESAGDWKFLEFEQTMSNPIAIEVSNKPYVMEELVCMARWRD
jgi:hypothetical protein